MLNIEKSRLKVKVIILIIFHLYILFFFCFSIYSNTFMINFFISRFIQMHFLIIFYVSWFNRTHFLILSSFVIIPKILIKNPANSRFTQPFLTVLLIFFVFHNQKLRKVWGRKYIYCFSGNFDSFNVLKGQLLTIWAVRNLVFL